MAQPRRGGQLGWIAAAVIAVLGIGGLALAGFGSREPAPPEASQNAGDHRSRPNPPRWHRP